MGSLQVLLVESLLLRPFCLYDGDKNTDKNRAYDDSRDDPELSCSDCQGKKIGQETGECASRQYKAQKIKACLDSYFPKDRRLARRLVAYEPIGI
jgi:hypothetical protein